MNKWLSGVLTKLYYRGNTRELWEIPVSMPLCEPQIPRGPIWDWKRASALRGRWQATWFRAYYFGKLWVMRIKLTCSY